MTSGSGFSSLPYFFLSCPNKIQNERTAIVSSFTTSFKPQHNPIMFSSPSFIQFLWPVSVCIVKFREQCSTRLSTPTLYSHSSLGFNLFFVLLSQATPSVLV